MGARQTALTALIACRKQGAWSDGVLKQYLARDRLDAREAALASRLCYGVLQNRMLLDFYIDAFLQGSRNRLQPITEDILRLGAYQLTAMDKIPVSAAVNESVELAKRFVNPGAAKLVNGVLRALARAEHLPEPPSLAIRYSHPEKLVQLLAQQLPAEELEPLLRANNEPPALQVQLNPLRLSPEQALAQLSELGVVARPHPWLQDCWLLTGAGNLERLPLFQSGALYVQDAAAHLAALAADAEPGSRVLDCCAAPGGKSFACAIRMQGEGSILSCDIHAHKLRLIEAGAARLGLSIISPQLQNAAEPNEAWRGAMDAVIADVPCSGFGVIRKKPDIRYKPLEPTERLPELQLQILLNQAQYVRPGGLLVYSTCTILRRENEQVVHAFLQRNHDFSLEPVPVPVGLDAQNNGMLTLYPHRHGTDGFFICRMRKHS